MKIEKQRKHVALHCRFLPALALCVIALAGCAGQSTVPEHKFYRLLGTPATVSAQGLRLPGELAVRPLRGDALYSERAIIFADEQQRQLQQYHYHHWLYPPGQLVQEHLADYLRRAAIAPAVRLQDHGDAPYAVSGRIVRFERITQNGQPQAAVALELRLEKKGKPLWQQTYQASEMQSDNSMNGFGASVEASLNRIYGEFLRDVARIKMD
jgi:ABC-type uncharacterized transport system auxiliary subunit